MILTSKVGTNADQFPDILSLYAQQGAKILDMTYGKGAFWSQVDRSQYSVLTNDLVTKADIRSDFRQLPLVDACMDMVILDPPYASHGAPLKASIDRCYQGGILDVKSSKGVEALYRAGIDEAYRVLRSRGILVLKTQDEIESGKQVWNHVKYLNMNGWTCEDLLVMVFKGIPVQRWKHQLHARKNHSYWIIQRKKV